MATGISKQFSVVAISDGVTYEIVPSVESVVIAAGQTSVSFSCTASFYRREGQDGRTAYSCYATVYRRSGSTFTRVQYMSSAATSITINSTNVTTSSDALVIFIFDSSYTGTSPLSQSFLAKVELPVLKNGDNGEDGADGTSPWIADLDNEMDSVACDSDGYATDTTMLYAKVSAFYGSTEKTSECTVQCTSANNTSGGSVQLVASRGQTSGGTAITTAQSMASAQYIRVAFGQGDGVTERGTVTLTIVHQTYGTRTLVFTVNGVRSGADGSPATIYNLLPDKTQINVGRSGSSYSPSTASVYCGYTKSVGDTIYEYPDASGQTSSAARGVIDGKYKIFFRKRTRSSQAWGSYYYCYGSYVDTTQSSGAYKITGFSVSTYDAVELIMCTATSITTRFSASNIGNYTVIDKETIPVVSDGVNGTDGTNGTNGTNGTDGDDAVIHEIECSPDSVNFRSNAVGDFSGSKSITCLIKKTVGDGAPATVSPGTDGLYLYWRKIGMPSDAWTAYASSGSGLPSVSASEAIQSSYAVTAVEFCLSTASSASNVSSSITASGTNIVKNRFVPVICDGRRGVQGEQGEQGDTGPAGATGKMFYSMGEWIAQSYSRTDLYVPMVHYDDGEFSEATGKGNYYWLNADSASSSDVPGTSSKWSKAQGFGVVITQGLFAEFAKMGKAIMSGDYMFSMNGYINGSEITNGTQWKGMVAYTLFAGDPVAKAVSVSASKTIGTSDVNLHDDAIQLSAGETLVVKIAVTARVTTTRLRLFAGPTSTSSTAVGFDYISSAAGTTWTTVSSPSTGLGLAVSTYFIRYTATADCLCYLRAYKTSGSGTMTYTLNRLMFEPNWWVDLLTGKMSAARGNFVVKPDGDVEVEGTIKANNLYRTAAMVWGGSDRSARLLKMGGSVNFFGSGTTTAWCYVKKIETDYAEELASMYGLAAGDYVEMTKDRYEANQGYWEDAINQGDFIVCTYNADIVTGVQLSSTYDNYVRLPSAADFEGKTVEVNNATSASDSYASSKVLKVAAADGVYIHWSPVLSKSTGSGGSFSEYGFNIIFGQSSSSPYFSIGASRTALFYSTGEFWICMKNENTA